MPDKFKNLIILTDLDGTFLGENSALLPQNLSAVEYFKSRGGRFTCATGREWWLVLPSLPTIGQIVNCPAITCNGAVLYDFTENKTIRRNPLDSAACDLAFDVHRQFPNAVLKITIGDKWYFPTHDFDHGSLMCPESYRLVVSPEEMPRDGWLKILFGGSPEMIAAIREYAEPKYPDYGYLQAWPDCLEIQSPDGTKGAVTSRFKALLGLPDATLWAVGDYENDVGMLAMADRRACPDNAIPCVKALDGIVPLRHHSQGAIADLIERLDMGIV